MTLLYLDLGVPVLGQSILFRDNKTVVDSTTPHSRLHKRHLMLSYHYVVREALASGAYIYSFVKGEANPSDVLSKH